jgi:hypothetical protein
MAAHHAALCVALLAAFVAGCSPLARFKAGKIQTGSVAPQEVEAPAAPAAPSLAAFEATEPSTGLHCTGAYNPLENSLTFTAAVVCEDGRMGEVTAARPGKLGGTGTLVFVGGATVSVALRWLAATDVEAPPSAAHQLPAPDPSAYVR